MRRDNGSEAVGCGRRVDDEEAKAEAQKIIDAQAAEIARMQELLARHGIPLPETSEQK